MKYIDKSNRIVALLLIVLLMIGGACTDEFEDYNTNKPS